MEARATLLDTARPVAWQPGALAVDPWLVLRLAGYRRLQDVTDPVRQAAAALAARAEVLVAPRAWLRVVPVCAGGQEVRAGPTAFTGRTLARLLAGCPLGVAFVLTLGEALEVEATDRATRGEGLEAYFLEMAGWAALETALRALRRDLRDAARLRGFGLTGRLGPGHADWPLAEQAALVSLVGPTGVRVTAESVLVPRKSVSGLFGLLPAAQDPQAPPGPA